MYAQVATLELDDLFDREAIVLIEWRERFPRLMPRDRIEIRLEPMRDDDDARTITLTHHSE